ncbi:MAG: radical SAM protein [Deltaproteobacteria bacterium]|nr:radical SAM protein [Deltaproteobacteria bacterium]
MLPTLAQAERRLAQVLAADSAQTGGHTDRLMLMLTRSCELRCAYCLVGLSEQGAGRDFSGEYQAGRPVGDMPPATVDAALAHLHASPKPRLGLQIFGGEPTRRWDLVEHAVATARRGREVEVQLTTNGLNLDDGRLRWLADHDVTVQLSVDGAGRDNRFRSTRHALDAAIVALRAAPVRWFLNVTVPPAASHELPDRLAHARDLGVPAVQLNYATGMRYTPAQFEGYLRGLDACLRGDEGRVQLYNWQNAADPAPLCGDVICDTDGTLLQVGGIFHEARFPALYAVYRRGTVFDGAAFAATRSTLAELAARTEANLSTDDWTLFRQGMLLGAAQDLVCRLARKELGR